MYLPFIRKILQLLRQCVRGEVKIVEVNMTYESNKYPYERKISF